MMRDFVVGFAVLIFFLTIGAAFGETGVIFLFIVPIVVTLVVLVAILLGQCVLDFFDL